jgi:hypothetical protein
MKLTGLKRAVGAQRARAAFNGPRTIGMRVGNLARVVRNTNGARHEALFVHARRVTPFLGVEHDGAREHLDVGGATTDLLLLPARSRLPRSSVRGANDGARRQGRATARRLATAQR